MFITGQLGHVNRTHRQVGGPYDILLEITINLYPVVSQHTVPCEGVGPLGHDS
jgi:hypothetical protein